MNLTRESLLPFITPAVIVLGLLALALCSSISRKLYRSVRSGLAVISGFAFLLFTILSVTTWASEYKGSASVPVFFALMMASMAIVCFWVAFTARSTQTN